MRGMRGFWQEGGHMTRSPQGGPSAGKDRQKVLMWTRWGSDPASGHPAAQQPPLGGGGWHKASVSICLPLAAPIGLSPLHILTLCGSERVLVVSTEPPNDLSCLTTPGVGRPRDGAVARAVDQGHSDAPSESVGGGGGSPTAGRGCPLGRTRPTATAVALLCVDPTQSSETGKVEGLHWHNLQGKGMG